MAFNFMTHGAARRGATTLRWTLERSSSSPYSFPLPALYGYALADALYAGSMTNVRELDMFQTGLPSHGTTVLQQLLEMPSPMDWLRLPHVFHQLPLGKPATLTLRGAMLAGRRTHLQRRTWPCVITPSLGLHTMHPFPTGALCEHKPVTRPVATFLPKRHVSPFAPTVRRTPRIDNPPRPGEVVVVVVRGHAPSRCPVLALPAVEVAHVFVFLGKMHSGWAMDLIQHGFLLMRVPVDGLQDVTLLSRAGANISITTTDALTSIVLSWSDKNINYLLRRRAAPRRPWQGGGRPEQFPASVRHWVAADLVDISKSARRQRARDRHFLLEARNILGHTYTSAAAFVTSRPLGTFPAQPRHMSNSRTWPTIIGPFTARHIGHPVCGRLPGQQARRPAYGLAAGNLGGRRR